MCKFIGKSNERILCKLRKSEILRLYSIVHVAIETTKTSPFNCQSKSFISIFFTFHDLANDLSSQTAKTVFSHLNLQKYREFSPQHEKKNPTELAKIKHLTKEKNNN